MSLKKITAANSPITLTVNDFSQLVNIPYCLLIASGGGVIDVTLPSIESINKLGQIYVICEDGITTVNINANSADAITESGAISLSKTISGNKNFVQLNAITYINGNIWLGSTNGGSGGGGGGGVTAITYNALVALAGAGNLTVGAYYLITDFQMVTYIEFSGGGVGAEDIHTGAIEPMIVQAASGSGIGATAISTVYPTDIINYSLLFADRDWDAVAGQSTGVITYREDTIIKNSRDYDFRNIIFRRWETVLGSGNYDSFTDTGFGFQDFSPYPNIAGSNKIGSLLLLSVLLGAPYQLDNVVFQGGIAVTNNIGLAFGATFQGDVTYNNITALFMVLVGDLNSNELVIFASNEISDKCQNNTCYTIFQNAVDIFLGNNCSNIENNFFAGTISRNCCFSISNNTSNVAAIISLNEVNKINGNTDFNDISRNTGSSISDNVNCQIRNNTVNSIESNSIIAGQLMVIENNSGESISQNTSNSATGLAIKSNNCNSIQSNLFLGLTKVQNNKGNVLNNNTFNGIAGSEFKSNGFVFFGGNTINVGGISANLFMSDIISQTFTPTSGMISGSSSVTILDSVAGNVEQILAAGVVSYVAF